ncbi:MAG: sigma 54-interacting transcriptional regulator [Planctomycetota bacterium]|nr:sigma 54-interacting transcriptional regulator [Planctomycetota bacterium]
MQQLETIAGRTEPEQLEVVGEILLGRSQDADLQVFDETASRKHARIRVTPGRVWLEDLGSANGTELNGEAVDGEAALFDGDVIGIGHVRLRYRSGEGAERVTVVESVDDVAAAVDPDRADPAREAAGEAAVRRLRLVCDGAIACADAVDEAEVTSNLLGLVTDAFACTRATVCLHGPAGRIEVVAAHPEGATPPTSRTLARRVQEGGEAVLVRDAHNPDTEGAGLSMVRSRYRSMLAAPLRVAEGTLGFVTVETEDADAFEEADLRALAAAARQAALALRNLRALHGAREEVRRLRGAHAGEVTPLYGEHASMETLRTLIAKAAGVDAPVLITGSTGTGKELVARHLHAGSTRAARPFVALNCAAIVEGLLESEFFGHEKGAFTGAVERREGRIAQAAEGTIFLDEVGELPMALQAKLLRVLGEGVYTQVGGKDPLPMRCRVLAATNRDLRAMVQAGTFREDLYYRLQVLEIHVPPLGDRGDDVAVLAERFIEDLAARMGRRVPRLAEDARAVLLAYAWPGNVRELTNSLERALVLLEGDTIKASDLPLEVRERRTAPDEPPTSEVLTMREAEKRAVKAALARTKGKKGAAAALLGISWPTLNRKIREYGL